MLEQKIARMSFTLSNPRAPVPGDISPDALAQENLVDNCKTLRQLVNGVNAIDIDPRIQRIIFFYSLDIKASFTERHDHTRACVAMIAYYMRREMAHELGVAHLKAIIEHQHQPNEFSAREAFISLFRGTSEPMMQVGSQERQRINRTRKYMAEQMEVAAGEAADEEEEAAEGGGLAAALEGFTLHIAEEFDAVDSSEEKMKLLKIMDGRTGELDELMQQLSLSDTGNEPMADA